MPDILVIKPSSFGDIVHGLQVIETIRAQIASARVSWVAASAFAPLVRVCDSVEMVYEFKRAGGVRAFWGLVRTLRQQHFDFVFDMQGLARSAMIARLARGDVKIGRRDTREGAGWMLPRRVSLPSGGLPAHAIDILLQFAPILGVPPRLTGHISFARAPDARAQALLPCLRGPVVLIFPESRRPEKNWMGFADLALMLLERQPDLCVMWSGRGVPEKLAHLPRERFVPDVAKLALDELPALMRSVDGVISNDSGPMHLAAAMGTRTLGVFGPTDPVRFGPYPPGNPLHRVVRAPERDLRRLTPEVVASAWLGNPGPDERHSTPPPWND